MGQIDTKTLTNAVLALFDEAYVGPANAEMPWFTDNEPDTGILGTLKGVSAAGASRPFGKDNTTIAAHTAHVRYALSLANRAFRGENPYRDPDWEGSWKTRSVTDDQWKQLLADLRTEYDQLRAALTQDIPWDAPMVLPGTLSQIAHGAWHLGAIRTLLEMV